MIVVISIVIACVFLAVYIYIDGVTHDKPKKKEYYSSKYKFEPKKYEIWNTTLSGETKTEESNLT